MKCDTPLTLIILDGFGFSSKKEFNAVYHAKKPHFDQWLKQYPHTLLDASGTAVGLLPEQIGNSEVGHLTIGAGKTIEQDGTQCMRMIADGSFYKDPTLLTLLNTAKKIGRLHLLGLLSDAGVHSHITILAALIKAAQEHHIDSVFIHVFLDGRDVSPQSAAYYLEELDTLMQDYKIGTLADIQGRFYAMDRNRNWERIQKSYTCLTEQQQLSFNSWQTTLEYYYKEGITDEFIPPTQFSHQGIIQNHDVLLFFNFRPDRMRQLVSAFVQPNFSFFTVKKLSVTVGTLTAYNEYPDVSVILKPFKVKNTLKEQLQTMGLSMFTIAETEKYAHVTYFFGGGKEEPFANETRVLIPSLPLKNYVEHPRMSAEKITDAVLHSLKNDPKDFYLINYANADMVGHSGNFQATVKAVEWLDYELGKLYKAFIEQHHGTMIITADHGNAEEMIDEKTGRPKTSHTTNQVYFLVIKKGYTKKLKLKTLADIAPCVISILKSC